MCFDLLCSCFFCLFEIGSDRIETKRSAICVTWKVNFCHAPNQFRSNHSLLSFTTHRHIVTKFRHNFVLLLTHTSVICTYSVSANEIYHSPPDITSTRHGSHQIEFRNENCSATNRSTDIDVSSFHCSAIVTHLTFCAKTNLIKDMNDCGQHSDTLFGRHNIRVAVAYRKRSRTETTPESYASSHLLQLRLSSCCSLQCRSSLFYCKLTRNNLSYH